METYCVVYTRRRLVVSILLFTIHPYQISIIWIKRIFLHLLETIPKVRRRSSDRLEYFQGECFHQRELYCDHACSKPDTCAPNEYRTKERCKTIPPDPEALKLKNLEKLYFLKLIYFLSPEQISISTQKEKKSFGVVLTRSILFWEMSKELDFKRKCSFFDEEQ